MTSETDNTSVGFIGCGRMGGAMIRGLIQADYPAELIHCTSQGNSAKTLAQTLDVRAHSRIEELIQSSDLIIIAVKPQQFEAIREPLHAVQDKLILSIMAGKPLELLAQITPNASAIVRAMPNLPSQIGQGVTAYCSYEALEGNHTVKVERVLQPLGSVFSIEEHQMDAFTALCGSGPGFFYEYIAALIESGRSMGFTHEDATKMVIDTLSGSLNLLQQRNVSSETLRDEVASPNGTTEAGLDSLTQDHFSEIIQRMHQTARNRDQELSQ